MRMEYPNSDSNSGPARPKLTMETSWNHEPHHTASSYPHEPLLEQNLSPRTLQPPPIEAAFNPGPFHVDPNAQGHHYHQQGPVTSSPFLPQQFQYDQDRAASANADVQSSQSGGSRYSSYGSSSNPRFSYDSLSSRSHSTTSTGQVPPEFYFEQMRKLMEIGGVDGLRKSVAEEASIRGAGMNQTPLESPRDSFPNLSNPLSPGPYPSPPSSVAAGSVCSKLSLPGQDGGSPRLDATETHPLSASYPRYPMPIPQQRQQAQGPARFRDRQPPNVQSPRGPPPMMPQEDEMSALGRAWGVLFDEKNHATERMGNVLRGIASYIMGKFPVESVVITPAMLVDYYFQHRLPEEKHPYRDVFRCMEDDKVDCETITRLFEEVECEYHLVKAGPKSRPMMPALTPKGFVKWSVMAIYAYPDDEAQRLDSVCKQGVDAAGPDGMRRLPAQLARNLLPANHNAKAREVFGKAVENALVGKKRVVVNQTKPPGPSRRESVAEGRNRERSPSRTRVSEPNIHRPRDKERDKKSDEDSDDANKRRKSVSFGRGYDKGPSRLEIPRRSSENKGRPYKSYHSVPTKEQQPPPSRSQSRTRRRSTSTSITEKLLDSLASYSLSSPATDGREKDRERRYREDRYGGDATPRRGPDAVEEPRRRRRGEETPDSMEEPRRRRRGEETADGTSREERRGGKYDDILRGSNSRGSVYH